ncbi:MAG: glycoside hydrolase family 3 C-terminal domain-containing protein [Lachnospiraceae bacterium]|nr:glycoside hydrolase family 3 C-terminal domain-containing protein [Lachnospiraceae bacterium]
MLNVELITKVLSILMFVFVIVMLRFTWADKNKKTSRKAIVSVVLVLMMVVNGLVSMFQNVINQHFAAVKIDDVAVEDAAMASRDITERIEAEGIVLLKNDKDSLPLATDKVNLFGIASIALTYGGAGSGASDESENVTLQEGLQSAGIEVNDELTKFYEGYKGDKAKQNVFNLKGGDYDIKEPAASNYSQDLIKNAKDYSDTAIVVISRNGGEGGDLPIDMAEYKNGDAGKHYLELQDIESQMLDIVEKNFDHVIVLINSSNAMELGFVEDDAVDAALWVGGPGSTGCNAIGQVLKGDVNPSGRLVDTYAYDLTSSPAYYNAGDFNYTVNGEKTGEHYVEYAEGIYTGYRYYETRYIDNETGKCDEDAYKKTVMYPFGYGLSYSTFSQEIVKHTEEDGNLSVTVKVTNTGDRAGKDVVQVYVTAPYKTGGIEKSFVDLKGFAKTKELKPGQSDEVTITFTEEDLASYDDLKNKAYVLEAGDYQIKLMANAHDLIDSYTYTVAENQIFGNDNPRSTDLIPATNVFEFARGDISYVTRSDWEGSLPKERITEKDVTQEFIDTLSPDNASSLYVNPSNDGDKIRTGEDNDMSLADMAGLAYDDSKWDDLLAQMSLEEMSKLVGFGGFSTLAIDSVGKVATIDIDGPAGLNALTSDISGVQFPSEAVIGSTFNTDLLREIGQVYANEASSKGVTGLYAPGINIHRTPFSGRNFEYYSEDPVLNGEMGTAMCIGSNEMGVYCYPKHFALNDQETNRSGVCVWANEQSIRQIYLKPFEMVVKDAKDLGMMSSYNRIGAVWAGGCKELLTDVLRNEWGFNGCVATDYANTKMMNADQSIMAGGSLMLSTTGSNVSEKITGTSQGQEQLQRAVKNILYMVVNSRAYVDPVVMQKPYWLLILVGFDMVMCLLIVFQHFYKKKNKSTISR